MSTFSSQFAPHGGALIDHVLRGAAKKYAQARAASLTPLVLSAVAESDLELIAVGALSPLTGFMGQADYERVVRDMRLANGLVWTIPITLPVEQALADSLHIGQEVALVSTNGQTLGLMTIAEKFASDKALEAEKVYRTTDTRHPGVARLMAQGDMLLAGDIWLIDHRANRPFEEFQHEPAQTRRMFAQRGWRRVVGFQTRNPIHRSHEHIQKTALEIVDGLFLHPLVGETKDDDIPADVRMSSYQTLLRDYYPPDRVVLGVFPAAMRYAGPREAVFHALCRKNYGCTHFIVGRDHAGVGNYYGPYDAQKIFDEFSSEELGITPLFFDNTFYCRKCGAIVSSKTCPHSDDDRVIFSGTQVRQMLERGEMLPPEFTRPEVSKVLMEALQSKSKSRASVPNPVQASQPPTLQPSNPPTTARHSSRAKHVTRHFAKRRVLVIGLDCAEPSLVFDKWRDELPHLSSLAGNGLWGELESCMPAITVPAWMTMMTSKDPGQLGFYGFRNRADHSYERMTTVNSRHVTHDTVWDILSRHGQPSIVIGVPPTYPLKPLNGSAISCFLTPSTKSQYTYPNNLRNEVEGLVGEYMVDVSNFRTEDKDWLLGQIYQMTDKRFKVANHWIRTKPWDFFMLMEIGVDRIHHAFWKYMDPLHPKHVPGNQFINAIRDYYRFVDAQIGKMLEAVDDQTTVMVVSDHGAKRMDGGIVFNEWLRREGYLVLKEEPRGVTPFEKIEVDWSRTKAWGAGGYYGRLFMNVQGREPQGIIPPGHYEAVRDELVERLASLTDDKGKNIGTLSYKPQKVYREMRNFPPDLIVYFGNLYWRAIGGVGYNSIHTFENDTGPDDANHAQFGLFIVTEPDATGSRKAQGAQITDVAPTILNIMGVEVPSDMIGHDLRARI